MRVKDVIFYKDVLASGSEFVTSEEVVGRKAESLFKAVKLGLPVPPFFVITTKVFNDIIKALTTKKQIRSLEHLVELLNQIPFPKHVLKSVEREYSKLSLLGKSWVAVRSSISAPEYRSFSFSGILDTYLNVRGIDEIELATKHVYASLFSPTALSYIKSNNISLSKLSLAAIVQKMITSEISGLLYTYNPVTDSNEYVTIEAVFGLGDVIGTGEINPDVYLVDKVTLELVEKRVVPQQWMRTRKVGEFTAEDFHSTKVTLSPVWQYAQKLSDTQIKELTQLAISLEQATGEHYIVEWTYSSGRLYILQLKKAPISLATFFKQAPKTQETRAGKKKQGTTRGQLILTGIPVGGGVIEGNVVVLTQRMINSGQALDIGKHDILVTDYFDPQIERYALSAGGVIADTGGPNADLALLLRESGIPAVVSTRVATRLLRTGSRVLLDADVGSIYLLEEPREGQDRQNVKKPKRSTTEPVSVHKPQPYPIDVYLPLPEWGAYFVRLGEYPSLKWAEYDSVFVEMDKTDLRKRIGFIKRIKDSGVSTLVVGVHSDDAKQFIELKKKLTSHKIIRSSRVKIVPVLATIAQLWRIERYLKSFVDGVVLDLLKIYLAYGGTTFDPKDSNFRDFLAPHVEKVKKEKFTIMGAYIDKLDIAVSKLIKLGFNQLVVVDSESSVEKIEDLRDKLSRVVL